MFAEGSIKKQFKKTADSPSNLMKKNRAESITQKRNKKSVYFQIPKISPYVRRVYFPFLCKVKDYLSEFFF
jgi:hypothetical protein